MAFNPNDLKQNFQRHLSQGLLVIVGSGLSCAEGLPGMGALATHLSQSNPSAAGIAYDPDKWASLLKLIQQHGVEEALQTEPPSEELADFIRGECAKW